MGVVDRFVFMDLAVMAVIVTCCIVSYSLGRITRILEKLLKCIKEDSKYRHLNGD